MGAGWLEHTFEPGWAECISAVSLPFLEWYLEHRWNHEIEIDLLEKVCLYHFFGHGTWIKMFVQLSHFPKRGSAGTLIPPPNAEVPDPAALHGGVRPKHFGVPPPKPNLHHTAQGKGNTEHTEQMMNIG